MTRAGKGFVINLYMCVFFKSFTSSQNQPVVQICTCLPTFPPQIHGIFVFLCFKGKNMRIKHQILQLTILFCLILLKVTFSILHIHELFFSLIAMNSEK